MSIKLKSFVKNVTTAGTRVPLSATPVYAYSVTLVARESNTGKIFVGDSSVDNTMGAISAGQAVGAGDVEKGGRDDNVNLADVYIDSAVNGEGVYVFYSVEG